MTKREKLMRTKLSGGIGANVIDGDLNLAIKIWKQEVKNSNLLKRVYEKKEYRKPSTERNERLSQLRNKKKKQ